MKAQTLSICLPGTACDKKCPYCVSKMTWAPPVDEESWLKNLRKVHLFAERAQATDVIFTGKGEPTLSEHLISAIIEFSDWPTVLQTNGKKLSHRPSLVDCLSNLNVIAVSIDDPMQMQDYKPLWDKISQCPPLTARITVMLTPKVCVLPFELWISMCKAYNIRGLSFRQITVPEDRVNGKASEEAESWIRGLVGFESIKAWRKDFHDEFNGPEIQETPGGNKVPVDDKRVIRRLPYGAVIKDIDGISVTEFEYCIQDSNGTDDIRSLVYNQDGHLYTTWSSPASMIF